jgi:hypothetical protein
LVTPTLAKVEAPAARTSRVVSPVTPRVPPTVALLVTPTLAKVEAPVTPRVPPTVALLVTPTLAKVDAPAFNVEFNVVAPDTFNAEFMEAAPAT